ncbi:MAG: transposase [Blastocatellia bacterium]
MLISANRIEGYFSILNSSVIGVYHHVSKQHLNRYLSDFDFRDNARTIEDEELVIKGTTGKMTEVPRFTRKRPKPREPRELTLARGLI